MDSSISLVRALLETLEELDVMTCTFLAETNFDSDNLSDSDGRVSLEDFEKLLLSALRLTDRDDLGLLLYKHVSLGSFNVLGYLMMNCATWHQALEKLLKFIPIVSKQLSFELVEKPSEVLLIVNTPGMQNTVSRIALEFLSCSLSSMGRVFNGKQNAVSQLGLKHSAPLYNKKLERIIGVDVIYDQPFNYMLFDRALLDRKQFHANDDLIFLLEKKANEMLKLVEGYKPYSIQTKNIIKRHFYESKMDMECVAQKMEVSSRTLRRYLISEGTSYKELHKKALTELAKQALLTKEESIEGVAEKLGYVDVCSFHRAFKGWTDQTPSEFRDAILV